MWRNCFIWQFFYEVMHFHHNNAQTWLCTKLFYISRAMIFVFNVLVAFYCVLFYLLLHKYCTAWLTCKDFDNVCSTVYCEIPHNHTFIFIIFNKHHKHIVLIWKWMTKRRAWITFKVQVSRKKIQNFLVALRIGIGTGSVFCHSFLV